MLKRKVLGIEVWKNPIKFDDFHIIFRFRVHLVSKEAKFSHYIGLEQVNGVE